jgi:hypothetical protein
VTTGVRPNNYTIIIRYLLRCRVGGLAAGTDKKRNSTWKHKSHNTTWQKTSKVL